MRCAVCFSDESFVTPCKENLILYTLYKTLYRQKKINSFKIFKNNCLKYLYKKKKGCRQCNTLSFLVTVILLFYCLILSNSVMFTPTVESITYTACSTASYLGDMSCCMSILWGSTSLLSTILVMTGENPLTSATPSLFSRTGIVFVLLRIFQNISRGS